MRISTAQIYDSGANGLLRNQYDLYKLQNQLSTGRRVVTPADDPVAASQALVTEQKQSVNQQFLDNQSNAKTQLAELESLMASVGNVLINAKSRWVEAGNGTYSASELKAIAVDLRGKYQEVLGVANSADANGLYRFAGYQAGTQPFVESGGSITYQGDSGIRQLQVEASRYMDVSYSGREFFEGIPQGNGVFVANAGSGNTGSGVISNGSTVGTFDGRSYELRFTSATNYELWIDGALDSTAAYTDGGTINLGGAQVTVSGTPATGDSFTVDPSTDESIFTTLDNFIAALESGDNSSADFKNTMLRVGASLDQAIQHVVDSRAVVGASMAELESLTSLGEDLDVQYESQISDLVDLDYAKAFTDLSKNQLQLQAAQQSFVKVTGLSLFNFI
ncbi:flagellar hook-associated protein FlgL [Azovibrio restrictus]|uniref:flagellar hook-associated protein FlgL n=1 Tax=Azovibrio restrictus TaxID=146938 RepID=UPI0026EC9649|nr:flagellar hook-associated protein FlgL [Azovibrio restrictus]MDD3481933.1 flagellar hook-associated protein FlgL [Azovibrio restrictus]